ncbi:DNA-binding transcriptional regulator, MarR family [Sulfobacillus thermosulfidooxidans DSM 9293]|uniref:DNA-binding transcriptional regulator, MarR family n=1 Tax=Sulfobacillus thermosulfidooxidans (strain DSM 9293 / VKM B-1269 / AT-1) TaxID=929705 RepID=A0A1W1WPQ5_SULTA|nr:MarR family transcriptional regulator [Sulfobacillus thermosulfidooxidans]SMC08216.1 DNA-binding transcriptional regulator, MarR family [Sulfobacillus thermosulfidooxidans DSM 9293]
MPQDSLHILRRIARRFALIQRKTWACCTPASEIQCLILTELDGEDGLSIRELADRLGSDPPWISRVVEELRQRGWISRSQDPRDRRFVRIELTSEGRVEAKRLQEVLNAQAESLLESLSPYDRNQLIATLEWLANRLDQELVIPHCSQGGEN